MNLLTKLFVVLLVVCSLLLSAAVVVFVNRVQDYKTSYDSDHALVIQMKGEIGSVTQALVDSKKEKEKAEAADQAHQGEKDRVIADLNSKLTEKDTTIAGLNKDKDVSDARNMGTVNALKAAETENGELQKTVADVRSKYDDVLGKFRDLNTAVTVSENKVRALTKTEEYDQEVISDLQNQIKTMQNKGVAGGGGAGGSVASAAGGVGSAGGLNGAARLMDGNVPDIKGVVRSVDMISGKKYATISVGSSSAVTKGMRFSIVNRSTGDFLGYVTIDNVQPDEAIGQVDGPQIDKIQAGVDVRTQL